MTITQTTSRRAVLAGAAALPALAAPAALAATEPDPIYAAIDRHKAAFLRMHNTGKVTGALPDDTEEHAAASAVEEKAIVEFDDVSEELLDLARTASPAAIAALLSYADAFNRGSFAYDREYGSSIAMHWPIIEEFEWENDDYHAGASFAWALLNSIRENLASKAVQS